MGGPGTVISLTGAGTIDEFNDVTTIGRYRGSRAVIKTYPGKQGLAYVVASILFDLGLWQLPILTLGITERILFGLRVIPVARPTLH